MAIKKPLKTADKFTPKAVLIDADAIVALAKEDDSNHTKACEIERWLTKKGYELFFSPFTLAEAVMVISYRVSHQSAKTLLNQLRKINTPVLELSEDTKQVDDWFNRIDTVNTSWFDCYNLALLENYSWLKGIFSFDKIYTKSGFPLINVSILSKTN